MDAKRPISMNEAAEILGITRAGVAKAVAAGRLVAVPINARGLALCRAQVEGRKFSEPEFRKTCAGYVSVPDACEIQHKTDASVIRDLVRGTVKGFKLNGRAWAVDRRSAEEEFRDYLANPNRVGQKRQIGTPRSPRVLRRKKKRV